MHDNQIYVQGGEFPSTCGQTLAQRQAQGIDLGSAAHPLPSDDEIIMWARELLELPATAGSRESRMAHGGAPAAAPVAPPVAPWARGPVDPWTRGAVDPWARGLARPAHVAAAAPPAKCTTIMILDVKR